MKKSNKIIIGLGSGRCGTQSLAKFLNIPHQGRVYSWQGDDKIDFDFLAENGGDVGSYYLRYINQIVNHFGSERVRFVCLRRNMKDTVDSFQKLIKDNKVDVFKQKFMPDIDEPNLSERQRLEIYYNLYYKTIIDFRVLGIKNIKIFDLDELNNPKNIKDFIGDWDYNEPQNIKGHCKIFSN